jgi:hypothetical protein
MNSGVVCRYSWTYLSGGVHLRSCPATRSPMGARATHSFGQNGNPLWISLHRLSKFTLEKVSVKNSRKSSSRFWLPCPHCSTSTAPRFLLKHMVMYNKGNEAKRSTTLNINKSVYLRNVRPKQVCLSPVCRWRQMYWGRIIFLVLRGCLGCSQASLVNEKCV